MTVSQQIVEKFTRGIGGARFQEIFDLLEVNHLHPLGKSNSDTLLFQFKGEDGVMHDLLAFRLGPPPVMSFPKSYWLSRAIKLNKYLDDFSFSEKPAITGFISDSQFSAGQIAVSKATQERLIEVCKQVCEGLS